MSRLISPVALLVADDDAAIPCRTDARNSRWDCSQPGAAATHKPP